MSRRKRAMVSTSADRHADDLAQRLGAALKDARKRHGLTQAVAAARAGFDQVTWSRLERSRDGRFTLATWDRAAHAVGTTLSAHLPESTAAVLPRDAVHLRNQELLLRVSQPGGWRGLGEAAIDRNVGRSRFADVLLDRQASDQTGREYTLLEVIDWFEDVGAPSRDWQRRLDAIERYAIARMQPGDSLPKVSGCWVVRATHRNRRLISDHRNFFRGRLPASSREWIRALTNARAPMPPTPGLLWVDVKGTRIFASNLGGG